LTFRVYLSEADSQEDEFEPRHKEAVMLRGNKSLITKALIFLIIIVAGVAFLLTDRSGTSDYTPEPTPAGYEDYPDANQDNEHTISDPPTEEDDYPPPRQPLTLPPTPFVCRCPERSHDIQNLSPPRPRHQPVQIAALKPKSSGNLLLETDGSLWAWGSNWSGQLGVGSLQLQPAPVQILDSVVYVSPGSFYAIREDGSLWGWGLESDPDNPTWPYKSVAPRQLMEDVSAVFQNENRDFVIRTDGSLWVLNAARNQHLSWGPRTVPDVESDAYRLLDHVADIYITQIYTYILQCNGRLWTLRGDTLNHLMDEVAAFYPIEIADGRRTNQVLIIQTDSSLWSARSVLGDAPPHPSVHLLDDVAYVSRLHDSDFILQHDGTLWAMGDNASGRLGDGTRIRRATPVKIMEGVASVHRSRWWGDQTFAITTNDELWGWGANEWGQLGHRSTTNQYYPVKILDNVKNVFIDGHNFFALSHCESLWAWGSNIGTSAGLGPALVAEDVAEFFFLNDKAYFIDKENGLWIWDNIWSANLNDGFPFRQILNSVVGFYPESAASFATLPDGSLWAWGRNWGHIGDGTEMMRQSPVNISYSFSYIQGDAPEDMGYVAVGAVSHQNPSVPFMAMGNRAFFYVDAANRLYAWGDNWGNQVGHELPPEFEWGPVPPGFVLDGVVSVYSRSDSTHALRADGSLWVWGFTHGSTPMRFMESIAFFTADWDDSFALGTDGSLWRWGHFVDAPPAIVLEQIRSFSWNNSTFFAHKTNGSLWSWGQNPMGVRGDNSPETVPSSTRLFVTDEEWESITLSHILDDIAKFITVGNSAYAIQNDGTLWAWGDNSYGQLGDGTRINRNAPVRIMDGVLTISVDGLSVYATRSDGGLWAWGFNALGQLGDGTQISRLYPVRVMDAPARIYPDAGTVYAFYEDNSLWAWGGGFDATPAYIMSEAASVVRDIWNNNMTFILQQDGNLWVFTDSPEEMEFVRDDAAAVYLFWDDNFLITTTGEIWAWGSSAHFQLNGFGGWVSWDSMVRIYVEG